MCICEYIYAFTFDYLNLICYHHDQKLSTFKENKL